LVFWVFAVLTTRWSAALFIHVNDRGLQMQNNRTVPVGHAPPRFDMYGGIHKAMRTMMSDALMALGRVDPQDSQELAATGGRVVELLDFCAAHLRHENAYIHAAMEARAPGSSDRLALEHDDHLAHIGGLKRNIATLCACKPAQAAAQSHALYQYLTLFVAENFHHMHTEETIHNALLWALFTDAELMDIHNALLASVGPAEMAYILRWMIPSITPAERAGVLAGMQANMPAPAFDAALDLVRPHLTPVEWGKLSRALGLAPVPSLATA
jgi:hypothetical protein